MSAKELSINQEKNLAADRRVDNWLTPAVDIYEDEEKLTLLADLPGVPRDRLQLGIDQGVLSIEALAPASEQGGALYREFGTTGYQRRFQLPDTLDFEKIAADLRDGVLTLTLPKSAAARPRRIEVSVH